MDLMLEVEKVARVGIGKMMVVEVCNSKIYRLYEDTNMALRNIYRRTNELVVFEYLNRTQDMPLQPKKQTTMVSYLSSISCGLYRNR